MPSLRNHDPLSTKLVTASEIDAARHVAESVVQTSFGKVQFDSLSRQRLNDIAYGASIEAIEWQMADNTQVTLTQSELRDLITEAQLQAGSRAIAAFQRAKMLKDTLYNGGRVTQRDIAPESWE